MRRGAGAWISILRGTVALIAALGATVATGDLSPAGVPMAAADGADAAVPAHPVGADPWLATMNWWRSFGGAADGSGAAFPELREDPTLDAGPAAQVEYLTSIWRAGSAYCGHGSDPAHPRGGGDFTHNVLFCGRPTLTSAVDGWMNTPYHAPPLLSPAMATVGAALVVDGTGSAAAARSGPSRAVDRPYTWPAPGGTLPATTMLIEETPDPTALCPPLRGARPGQPIFAWFPDARQLASAAMVDAAGPVPMCVLGTAPGDRPLGAGDRADSFVLFPQRPLMAGGVATATLTTVTAAGAPDTLTWSFRPVTVPGTVTAAVSAGAPGTAVVDVPGPLGADGGSPVLELQLQLRPRALGADGEPAWRIPLPGTGRQTVAAPPGDYWACVAARNAIGWSSCATFTRVVVALGTGGAPAAGFVAVDPVRLVDTRAAGAPFGRLAGGRVSVLDLRGAAPADATAVALNLAAVSPSGPGWVRAFPCTAGAPATSNLNPDTAGVTTSAAIVKLGDRRICVQSLTDTDLVIDLNGWLTTSSDVGLVTSAARRILDTRAGTSDIRRLAAGSTVSLHVAEPRSGTTAVSLNVTAVDPGANGFVTAWPCGTPRPFVANLNPAVGATRPNLVNVRVGADGSVCLFTTGATDLVVDLIGELRHGAPARFVAIDPVRLADTRAGSLPSGPSGEQLVPSGEVVALQGVLTAVTPPANGYLAAFACTAGPWPGTANVTVLRGSTSGNAALMASADQLTCIRDTAGGDVVVDVSGVWKIG